MYFQQVAIAVDREIAQPHSVAAHHQDRAAIKVRRRPQHRPPRNPADLDAGVDRYLRMNLGDARGEHPHLRTGPSTRYKYRRGNQHRHRDGTPTQSYATSIASGANVRFPSLT